MIHECTTDHPGTLAQTIHAHDPDGVDVYGHTPHAHTLYAQCSRARNCKITAHAEHLYPVVADGIYLDDQITEDDYYGARALSQSTAKKLLQPGGPAKVRWELDHKRIERREFDLGHAAHSLVLGSGAGIVDIGRDLRSKATQDAEKKARSEGLIPLRSADYRVAHDMAEAIQRNTTATALLSQVQPEVSLFHTRDGMQVKGRVDGWGPNYIIDYKSTQDASDGGFAKSAAKFSYHLQASAYLELSQLLDQPKDQFLFIAQEKTAPYLVNVVELSPDFLDAGHADWQEAIQLWRECLTTGSWPGYAPSVSTLHPPYWLARRIEHAELDTNTDALTAFLEDFLA